MLDSALAAGWQIIYKQVPFHLDMPMHYTYVS